jgi:hypothetical protein
MSMLVILQSFSSTALTHNSISVVTGTPPTIRVDSSIMAAPILLQTIATNCDVFIILSHVELALIWHSVGIPLRSS